MKNSEVGILLTRHRHCPAALNVLSWSSYSKMDLHFSGLLKATAFQTVSTDRKWLHCNRVKIRHIYCLHQCLEVFLCYDCEP